MTRYKCTVAYVGRDYDGWQSQKLGLSVQEKIESVIRSITCEHTNIIASGRTDAGVNASGQVFQFDTERDMTERKWIGAINGYLPKDIHIMKVEKVSRRFHARYCVRKKTYVYRINIGPYDVFTKDIAYQCPIVLDVEKMKEASRYLVGTHDFTSLNSSSLKEYPDQVRTIESIDIRQERNMISIAYTGKGFLRYMVRMMTAQLIEAGRHRIEPAEIEIILQARSKTIARRNAPANGLTLENVDYFDIAALNQGGMLREYLLSDPLPEGMTLAQLEENVREKKMPMRYLFTTRHSQEPLGFFLFDGEKGTIFCRDEEAQDIAENFRTDLQDWFEEKGFDRDTPVEIRGE
jgi:tRNA pseudouridine38-40 synthase